MLFLFVLLISIMCISPITIKNPRIDFRKGLDKLYVTVPCNHCPDCMERKSDDMYVRLFYEFKRSKRVIFPTFTYNDGHLPSCNLHRVRKYFHHCPFYSSCPSFDKSTFQKMLKKLRTYFDREGYQPFKYFVGTEYGGKRHRPHYHALFFLQDEIDATLFKNMCEKAWSEEVPLYDIPFHVRCIAHKFFNSHPDECYFNPCNSDIYLYMVTKDSFGKYHYFYKRGFVQYSEEHGPIVSSISAVRYVTKYIHKPQSFMQLPAMTDISNFIRTLPALSSINKKVKCGKHFVNNPVYTALISAKDILPFYLVSNGLGDELYHQLQEGCESPEQHEDTIKRICKNSVEIDSETYTYAIPRYVIRKLFYEYINVERTEYDKKNNTITYEEGKKTYLNSLGVKCLKLLSKAKCERMSKKFSLLYDDNFINSLLPCCNNIQKELLTKALACKPYKVDFELLAFYKLFLQNVTCQRFNKLLLFLEDGKKDYVKSFCDRLLIEYYDTYNVFYSWASSPYTSSLDCEKDFANHGVFNQLKYFDGFDKALLYFQYIQSVITDLRYENEEKKKQVGLVLRQYYQQNFNHYV